MKKINDRIRRPPEIGGPVRQLTARLQISACRMVVHNGVFCGTEAGAATTEKGALSGIKVLDLTRSENESVRYIIQM